MSKLKIISFVVVSFLATFGLTHSLIHYSGNSLTKDNIELSVEGISVDEDGDGSEIESAISFVAPGYSKNDLMYGSDYEGINELKEKDRDEAYLKPDIDIQIHGVRQEIQVDGLFGDLPKNNSVPIK